MCTHCTTLGGERGLMWTSERERASMDTSVDVKNSDHDTI